MTNPEPNPAQPTDAPPTDPSTAPAADPPKDDRQAEIDRIVAERVAREKRKHADETKDLRAKAAEADRLRKERETETEKAIREAEERGRNAALAESRPRLVLAEIRAAAAGRIDPSRLDDLVDDIDLGRYVRDDGSVDVERVRRKVDAWSPPKQEPDKPDEPEKPSGPRRPRPDPTQGTGRSVATGDGDRGVAEARKRFGNRAVGPAAARQ